MNLEPAPRLPKWIFFAIDAGLLTTAFIIIFFNDKNPYAPIPLVCAVICVLLAAACAVAPFIVDYESDKAEFMQRERTRADEQLQRLHAASESLARAAAQIKAVEEAVHKTAHSAENLPYRMQEKLAEFNSALAQKEESDQESLEQELADLRAANSEQLRAVADKIQKAAADWSALESGTRKHFAAAEASLGKIQIASNEAAAKFEARLAAALATVDARLARLEVQPPVPPANVAPISVTLPTITSVAPEPVSPPANETPAPSTATEPPLLVESVAVIDGSTSTESSAAASEEIKAKKVRSPRRPKPEETLAAMSESPGSVSSDEIVHTETLSVNHGTRPSVVTSARSEIVRTEQGDSASSSDGATRLLATAYIGIGNKLFIRGEGPGLSLDKGVPMQFVSIGKWGWATNDATAPIRCELYKNDETIALTGEVILDPGKHVEITALF